VSRGSLEQPKRTDEDSLARIMDATEGLEAAFAYASRFGPVLDLALDEFLSTAQWPERERFRRQLTQHGLGQLNLDEMWRDMPRSPWEQAAPMPDRIVLSLQTLQEMRKARPLLDTCMAIVRRAYELYSSETDDDLKLSSDDPILLSATGGDAGLLLRAIKLLDQHPPSLLGGWSGPGPESTPWGRWLHQTVMPAFGDVTTIKGYLAAQARIIDESRQAYGSGPGSAKVMPSSKPKQLQPSLHDERAPAHPESLSRGATEVTSTKGIFLSHAHADLPLADLLHDTLVLGGVPGQRLFYSSSRATGIPSGEDVRPYLRRTLREAELVIELVSERFLTRPYCLMELGGAWALGTPTYPIVVPPLTRDMAAQQIGNVQMGFLGTESDIGDLFDELHDRLAQDVGISAGTASWNRAIRHFKQRLPETLAAARTSSTAPSSGTLTASDTTAEPSANTVVSLDEITISNVTVTTTRRGKELFGEVTNNDDAEHSAIIKATFYNAQGEIIGTESGVVNQLRPGATKTINIQPIPSHNHYRIEIDTLV
jgi:hypothetical protein